MAKSKIKAGEAVVELGVMSNVDKGLKVARESFKKFGKQLATAGAGITGIGSAALAPMLAMTQSFQSAGDQLHKMSIRTGISVEALSGLKFAAEQSGSSIESVGAAMFRTSRRIANAAETGAGPAARAIKLLGINAQELSAMSPERQMLALADVLGGLENEAFANQMGFEILGDSFKDLQPLMKEGSAGIRALMEENRRLGGEMSGPDAQAAADYGDALNRLKTSMTGVKNQIGAALAPALTDLVDRVVNSTKGIRDFIAENRQVFVTVAAIAAGVVGFGSALAGAGAAITLIGTALGTLASMIAFLASPIGIAIAAVAALGVAIFKWTDYGGKAVDWLIDRFGPLVSTVKDSLAAIQEAFASGDFTKAWELVTDSVEAIWLDLTNGIRGYWDSTVKWILDISVGLVEGLASMFKGLAEMLGKMLDGYKTYYNSVFNWVTEKIGDLSGVRTLGGPVDAFAGSGMEAPLRSAIAGMTDFADGFADTYSDVVDQRKKDRDAAADERKKRLDQLRSGLAEEGQAARESREARKREELERPKLDELNLPDLAAQQKEQSKTAGTFSAFAAGLLGQSSANPQVRMAKGIDKIADSNEQIAKSIKRGAVPKFGA